MLFTKLGVIVLLFCVNCLNKVIDKTFDMLLDLLRLVPNGKEKLPLSFYAKIMSNLRFSYEKIDTWMIIICFIGMRTGI